MPLPFLAFLGFIISNGQTIVNPTTSNSTGDYYIADQETNFDQSEIECSSDVACYIECNIYKSCQNLTIDCGNAPICDIQCDQEHACFDLSIYISPEKTTLSCSYQHWYWYACSGTLTLYNDYTNYPLSTTIIGCWAYFSCEDITIKDAATEEDNYDKLTVERFKIFCNHIWTLSSCEFANYAATNLTATPSIINETGEFYSDTGSLVNFKCNTDKLCYIDCSYGGCYGSKFDCGDAKECTIFCGDDTECVDIDVVIAGVDKFNFYCAESSVCKWSSFNLKNIGTVNITCDGRHDCTGNDWIINSVQNLNVFCNFYKTCSHSDWFLTDVDNAVIICNGSCLEAKWQLNNVGYQKIDCIGDITNQWASADEGACNGIEVNGVDTKHLYVLCENEHACQYMTICMEDDIFNLECPGYGPCNSLNLCDETAQSNQTNIVYATKPPTPEPTTSEPTTSEPTTGEPTTAEPTTALPTQQPTTTEPTTLEPTTAEPTTVEPTTPEPTVEPTQQITTLEQTEQPPTTAQPTEPNGAINTAELTGLLIKPTQAPTKGDGTSNSNVGNRLIEMYCMAMVVFIAFLPIMEI